MSDTYVVLNIGRDKESKSGSGTYDAICLMKDGKTYFTYVAKDYKNRPRWEEIIRLGKGTKIVNLKLKSGSDNIIDADSNPLIVATPLPPKKKKEQLTLGAF